jgi:hypothetical protein
MAAKGAHGESETGTLTRFRILKRFPAKWIPVRVKKTRLLLCVRRLGVADHALHGGKGAA